MNLFSSSLFAFFDALFCWTQPSTSPWFLYVWLCFHERRVKQRLGFTFNLPGVRGAALSV